MPSILQSTTIDHVAITKDILDFVLDIDNGADHTSFRVSQSTRGDGQLDPYLSILSNDAKPWITREYGSITPPKKQIIFSNGHYKLHPKQPIEEHLVAAIIKHYDVIVFKKGVRIQYAEKATNIIELNQVDGAVEEDVKSSLASQGEACENYYIIDYHEYIRALQRIQTKFSAYRQIDSCGASIDYRGRILDLEFVSANEYEELLKIINPDEIYEISVSVPNFQDLAFIQKNFRRVNSLRIKNVDQEWINKYWLHLKISNIILDNFKGKRVAIPRGVPIQVQFRDCEELSIVESENVAWKQGDKCPKLSPKNEFNHFGDFYRLDEEPNKENMDAVVAYSDQDWSLYPKLTHLILIATAIHDCLNLGALPTDRLESLILFDEPRKRFKDAIHYPALTYLKLRRIKTQSVINNSKYPALRTLIIDNQDCDNGSPVLPILTITNTTLTRLEIWGNYHEIRMEGCENLEIIIVKSRVRSSLYIDTASVKNVIQFDTTAYVYLSDDGKGFEKLKKFSGAPCHKMAKALCGAMQMKYLRLDMAVWDCNYQDHYALRSIHSNQIFRVDDLPSQDFQLRHLVKNGVTRENLDNVEQKQADLPIRSSRAVMIYDNMTQTSVDGITAASKHAYVARGSLAGALEANHPIVEGHLRVAIFDTIVETIDPATAKPRLIFLPTMSKSDMQSISVKNNIITDYEIELMQAAKNANPMLIMGYMQGEVLPHQVYSMLDAGPVKGPASQPQIFCENAENFEFYWHPKHQHYYFYLKPNQPAQVVVLRYLLSVSPAIKKKDFIKPISTQLLSDNLRSKIKLRLSVPKNRKDKKRLKELQFLFSTLPPHEKLNKIVLHCENFAGADLSDVANLDLDVLLDEIIEQKGSCRHRAQACMLLFHFLNCELLLSYNPLHAYTHFPTTSGELHVLDLGGLELRNATDKKCYDEVAEQLHQLPAAPHTTSLTKHDRAVAYYEKKLAEKINIHELNDYELLLDSRLHHPLVLIDSHDEDSIFLSRVTECIHDGYKGLSNYLYINKPADLEFFLRPYALINNCRVQITGPLKNIIKDNGIIIVNWKNFSAADRGNYKSILDELASIKGEFISGDVRIIGMVGNDYLQPAFESRCTKVRLRQKLLSLPEEKMVESNIVKSINLFNRADWREPLLGEVEFANKGARIVKGPLIEALLNGTSLVIENPPVDPDFHVLIKQVKYEKRIYWNGGYVVANPGFSLLMEDKPIEVTAVNIKIIPEKELPDNIEKIYLTNNTFHECFKRLIATSDNFPVSLSGYLQSYDPRKNVFYISEPIQLSAWKLLNDFVLKKFPDKPFVFVFAPGSGVVADNKVMYSNDEVLPTHKPIIFTNDPDFYLVEQKVEKVAFVNLQTTFPDLIAEKKIVFQNDSGEVNLFVERKGVLNALTLDEKGEDVVLCGSLTPTEFNKLLPLFCKQPHIDVNGLRLDILSSLSVVMPISSKYQFVHANQIQMIYSLDDYQRSILPSDLENFFLLKRYVELVHKLPQKLGRGRPEEIVFTFGRITRMLDALRDGRLHPQNPVKGLINYDFPKNSEDYAYLNVVGKMIFRPNSTRMLRIKKISSYPVTEENIWRLLNCFSGAELKEIFDESKVDLKFSLSQDDKKTILNLISWHIVLAKVELSSKKSVSENGKFERQLETLLEDPKKTLCIIQGPPGVGKTRSLRNLANRYHLTYVEGFKNIKKWLEARSDKPIIFGIDEYNLSPDMSNFLKGINLAKKEVYFDNKFYPLTPMHKIFATGNPASFPHRFYHEFFQQQGETIYLTMPKDEVLLMDHIHPAMDLQGCSECSRHVLTIYKLIQQIVPYRDYSFRSLYKFMDRFFSAKAEKPRFENIKETLYKATMEEFALSIEDPILREKFGDQVATVLAVLNRDRFVEKDVLTLTATFLEKGQARQKSIYIPPEKIPIIKAIQHDINLMRRALTNPSAAFHYHRCILVEGPIGVGKSTNFQFILQNNGYSLEGQGVNRYYIIHANDPEAPAILLKAFHEGSKVILEELNANKQIEILLNQLLEGADDQGQPSHVLGFMVFASQNPSTEVALGAVSTAAKDRMHVLYVDPMTDKEVEMIAAVAGIADPKALSQAQKNKLPHGSNSRFLMQLIQEEKSIQAATISPNRMLR